MIKRLAITSIIIGTMILVCIIIGTLILNERDTNTNTINATVTDINDRYITLTDEQGEQWIIDNTIVIQYDTNDTNYLYDDEIIDIGMSR
jgi:DNA replication protein DnaD